MELFSKNGVKAILANSRPNDGTRALVEANRKAPRGGFAVVPFIRVYRDRADYGTWHANPDIAKMIEDEEKRGYYRGVGEFHVFGREAASDVVKRIVNFAVAKNLVLHAHCDEEALELLFAHNPKARVIWAHTGFSTPLARVEELLRQVPAALGRALLPLGRGRGRQARAGVEGLLREARGPLPRRLRHLGEPALAVLSGDHGHVPEMAGRASAGGGRPHRLEERREALRPRVGRAPGRMAAVATRPDIR